MTSSRIAGVCIAVILLAGCTSNTSGPAFSLFESKGEKTLSVGISLYDEGKYDGAILVLQSALGRGLGKDDQVKAYKYIAFAYCVSGKQKQCGEAFGKALDIDPSMELAASEAGHPTWGPVFKNIKTKRK